MALVQITVTMRMAVTEPSRFAQIPGPDGKAIAGLVKVGPYITLGKDVLTSTKHETIVRPVITQIYLAEEETLSVTDDRLQLRFIEKDSGPRTIRLDGDVMVGMVSVEDEEGIEEQAEEVEEAPRRGRRANRQEAVEEAPARGRGRRRPEPEPEPEEEEAEWDPDSDEGEEPEDGDGEEEYDDQDPDEEGYDDGDSEEIGDDDLDDLGIDEEEEAPAKPARGGKQQKPAGRGGQRRAAPAADDDFDLSDLDI